MADLDSLIIKLNWKAAGYMTERPEALQSFGEAERLKLLPYRYLTSIQPIGRWAGRWHDLPDFGPETGNRILYVNDPARDRYAQLMQSYDDAILIYSKPLPLMWLAASWEYDEEDKMELSKPHNYMPRRAYMQRLKELISSSRLVAHYDTRSYFRFLAVASRETAGEILDLLVQEPGSFFDMLTALGKKPPAGYEARGRMVFYDKGRWSKTIQRKIQ